MSKLLILQMLPLFAFTGLSPIFTGIVMASVSRVDNVAIDHQSNLQIAVNQAEKPKSRIRLRPNFTPSTPVADAPSVEVSTPPPAPTEVAPLPKVEIPPPPTIFMGPPRGTMPVPAPIPAPVTAPPPPPPPVPAPDLAPSIEIESLPKVKNPTPVGNKSVPAPDYCYVGTWQITDLSDYWLPMIQHFTQAKVADPQTIGYGKVILTKDGKSLFESFDFEQRYNLKSKETGNQIDKVSLSLAGRATARFQDNNDRSLTFSSPNYRRMGSKLHLGEGLSLESDRLFTIFGNRDKPPAKLPYQCKDGDRLILKIPMPTGNKFIPIGLKRVS